MTNANRLRKPNAAEANGVGSLFQASPPRVAGNRRLREPQMLAHEVVCKHFEQSHEPVLVQMPVGCGKSGLMAILPFGISQGRVLLVAPNVTIREGLFRAVDSGSKDCFWRNAGVAPLTVEGPFAAKIDGPEANFSDCEASHFVVTNVQQVGTARNKWLPRFASDYFDMILIDEGHHNAAASWRRLMEHFPQAKIVSLTATPFRSDKKKVIGKMVYRYSFLRSMCRGYIKTLRAVHVRPCELSFTFRDSEETCTLEQVLKLKEEDWFSRGVALAEACNRHVVRTSIQECQRLRRQTGTKHQIIAVACSVDHAKRVAEIYRELGYAAQAIHSHQTQRERENILGNLYTGRIDAIIQVQLLGEGFDHPPLSVAAVLRPFRTLSPYVQFVGRIMRTVRSNRPGDPNNQGVIVSHVGLNTERHWKDFQQLDDSDQSLWRGLSGGSVAESWESDPQDQVGQMRMPYEEVDEGVISFSPEMLVDKEILGEAAETLFDQRATQQSAMFPAALSVEDHRLLAGPQAQRRASRSRLKNEVDDCIRRVLAQSGYHALGWQIGRSFRFLGRQNNWSTLRYWLYCELNRTLRRRPGSGKQWSLAEVEQAIDALPTVSAKILEKLAITNPRRRKTWPRSGTY